MQQTRRYILEILREQGDATVDELVNELKKRIHHTITAVTVRHHLDILRGDSLVTSPEMRRSGAPGRPQYVYSLTDKALELFPNNYQNLMNMLLNQLKTNLTSPQVNVIMDGVADQMVAQARFPEAIQHVPMAVRLDHVVNYLNQNGYDASWEATDNGYILRTRNCPYSRVAQEHGELCGLDMRLVAGLVGATPRVLGRLSDSADSCAYLITVPRVEHS